MKLEKTIQGLLYKRGYRSEKEIQEFLSDHPRETYDPFLLLNMEAGVDLLLSAAKSGKKICIYGDYDVDGITATVILTEVLSCVTENITHYQPSRFTEGYGLNEPAIKRIYDEGSRVLVTVDCGIVSKKEAAYAESLGMDVLITDHHTVVQEKKPDCLVINPHQPECPYPFKDLAGCGVAYKLAQGICRKQGLPHQILTSLLDLVAIGTVADIVPLVGENRTLVKYGLKMIRSGYRKNLAALIDAAGISRRTFNSENIAFGIGPHLNAAGRLKTAEIAVDLFLTKDPEVLRMRIEELVWCNAERKKIQTEIYEESVFQAEAECQKDHFLTISLEKANEGVTGIACGKIKERYYLPTVIITATGNGQAKGTGRSIEGVDLFRLLQKNQDLFSSFGGHKAACGFTMKQADIRMLRENLRQQAEILYEKDPKLFTRKIVPDMILAPEELSFDLVRQIALLEPFGEGNPSPLAAVFGYMRNGAAMGREEQYYRFDLVMDNGKRLRCVVFNNVEEIRNKAEKGNRGEVMVCGSLQINTFRGNSSLQLLVENICDSSAVKRGRVTENEIRV